MAQPEKKKICTKKDSWLSSNIKLKQKNMHLFFHYLNVFGQRLGVLKGKSLPESYKG